MVARAVNMARQTPGRQHQVRRLNIEPSAKVPAKWEGAIRPGKGDLQKKTNKLSSKRQRPNSRLRDEGKKGSGKTGLSAWTGEVQTTDSRKKL